MMGLRDVFCQERAIDMLQKAYACGRVPHAYIFAGADGVGRFTTALQWARLLLCHKPVVAGGFADSCGVCESCRIFAGGAHPDFAHVYKELREYTKDGKGKAAPVEMPIDVIREFLVDKITARPALSPRRVFVVSEGEKLNNASQNCLLKSLEEPPDFCHIILLCTRLERLLPTTRSRCQIVRFGPVAVERITQKLREMGLAGPAVEFFGRFAAGSIGRACRWGRLELDGAGIYEAKKAIVQSLAQLRYGGCLDAAERWIAMGKQIAAVWEKADEGISKSDINRRCQGLLLEMAVTAINDAMKLALGVADDIVHADQRGVIQQLAGWMGPEGCGAGVTEGYEAMRWVESSVNEKLIFEHLLLKLAEPTIMADRAAG